jgi:hypothetical protein
MSRTIAVCDGTICRARSLPVQTVRDAAAEVGAEVALLPCLRSCWVGPIVGVFDGEVRTVLYGMHGDDLEVLDRMRSACSNSAADPETTSAYDPNGCC